LERERRALGDLFRQREGLATKIAKQQTRVAALAALCDATRETSPYVTLQYSKNGIAFPRFAPLI